MQETMMALHFTAGLALKMYPAELLKYGAICLGSDGGPVESEHYFLGIRILVWEDRTSPSCLTALVR